MFVSVRFMRLASMSAVILALLQGCSMSLPDYPAMPIDQSRHAQQTDVAAAAISPIVREDQSKKYFGVNMLSRNILPVHVLVKNKANGVSFILDRERIFLEGDESYDHNNKADQNGTGEVLATVGSAALVTGPLVAAPVGILIGSKMTSDAQMVQQNMMAKRLDRHTLSPGTSEHGFVYFDMTKYGSKYPTHATVRIELIELGSNEKHTIDLPFQWED